MNLEYKEKTYGPDDSRTLYFQIFYTYGYTVPTSGNKDFESFVGHKFYEQEEARKAYSRIVEIASKDSKNLTDEDDEWCLNVLQLPSWQRVTSAKGLYRVHRTRIDVENNGAEKDDDDKDDKDDHARYKRSPTRRNWLFNVY